MGRRRRGKEGYLGKKNADPWTARRQSTWKGKETKRVVYAWVGLLEKILNKKRKNVRREGRREEKS